MDIVFQGSQEGQEIAENIALVMDLFKSRYQIQQFRDIRLTVTLVNDHGEEVDLVDGETNQAYRVFEVYRDGYELRQKKTNLPPLKLIVDNTRNV